MTVKMYLENPYLKELKGTVIKKEKKDDKYQIILNRTIFYPRHSEIASIDNGTINGVGVIDVFKEKDNIIHITEKDIGSKDVILKIDWSTRFDYMQQHTGGHIISAAINKLYGIDTLGFEFDLKYSYIKTRFKELKTIDLERIEKFANNMVYSNFKIKHEGPEMVSMENINLIACKGLHCCSTGEVGLIKLIKLKNNSDENIDIAFLCGNRALDDYGSVIESINQISQMLSIEKDIICDEIEKILRENRQLKEKIENTKNTKASENIKTTIDDSLKG